jgi:hypothetical protein
VRVILTLRSCFCLMLAKALPVALVERRHFKSKRPERLARSIVPRWKAVGKHPSDCLTGFVGETFDPKRRGKGAIWARLKSRLETDFLEEGN